MGGKGESATVTVAGVDCSIGGEDWQPCGTTRARAERSVPGEVTEGGGGRFAAVRPSASSAPPHLLPLPQGGPMLKEVVAS
jgi:hypothetical protein